MKPFSPSPGLPPELAVLLVLLPPLAAGQAAPDALSNASIRALQVRLAPDVRVLRVDEASHPAVVHSFGTPELPACVLVRQGVELWRQQGLPDDESTAALLAVARAPHPTPA